MLITITVEKIVIIIIMDRMKNRSRVGIDLIELMLRTGTAVGIATVTAGVASFLRRTYACRHRPGARPEVG